MYQFNYKKVETIEEAVNELSANPESKILAGGMTLIPTMKQRLASPEPVSYTHLTLPTNREV